MTRSRESAIRSKPSFALNDDPAQALIHWRGGGAALSTGGAENCVLDRYADLL